MSLLPGYTMRAPTMDDAQAVADIIIACDMFESGFSDFTIGRVLDDWQQMDLATATRVVVAPDGRIVGSEDVFPNKADITHYDIDGYVHPEHIGLGIGSWMVRDAEARIRQHLTATAGKPIKVHVGINDRNEWAHQLFREASFAPIRYFRRMEYQMNAAPPAPQWPSGITLRPFVPGQDERAVFAADQEAFQDHWGYIPGSFEEWSKSKIGGEGYAPELWLLAYDGDEIAGAALCYDRAHDGGWVRALSVRRPWRRAGLGMALLQAAFSTFYERGRRWVGLGVDADSPTGATRLYERAGMTVKEHYATYEKILTNDL